jgi:hypothetical protein
MRDGPSDCTQSIVPQSKWDVPNIPEIDRHAWKAQRISGIRRSLNPSKAEFIAGRAGVPGNTVIDGSERVCDCATGSGAEALSENPAGRCQLGFDGSIREPRESAVGCAMGAERKPSGLPCFDLVPAQML